MLVCEALLPIRYGYPLNSRKKYSEISSVINPCFRHLNPSYRQLNFPTIHQKPLISSIESVHFNLVIIYILKIQVDPKKANTGTKRMKTFSLPNHADSLLPADADWKLVWHDEFDGTELDSSKWGFRRNFWGAPMKTYTDEGVELDGNSNLKLHLLRKGDDFYSPHLQTGSLTFDMPKDTAGIWPFGKPEAPRFLHRFGFYEIRCKLPKNPGWHAAFWLQAPGIGSHPDPTLAGVEVDVMENYWQHTKGKMMAGNLWGGYGKDYRGSGHIIWDHVETPDGWHTYAVDWRPDSYTFYADGQLIGKVVSPERASEENRILADERGKLLPGSVSVGPISNVDQFILVSTECHGYRGPGFNAPPNHPKGTPAPILFEAELPDVFIVDHVRVFDRV
jgi:hypothetical protein